MKSLAFVLGSFLVLASACGKQEAAEKVQQTAVRVRAASPSRGSISDTVEATGETVALRTLRIASPIAGKVIRLDVRQGDSVHAGGVVAQLRTAESDAAVRGLSALGADPVLAPEDRKVAAELRRELALREVLVRAPFAAVVGERLRNPGEEVSVGDVLLEVFDPRSLEAVAQVPLDQISRVAAGMSVEIQGGTFKTTGKVIERTGALAGKSLTVPVRIALSDSSGALLRAPVVCRIVVAKRENALLLPRASLLEVSPPHASVLVVADGHAQTRDVELGVTRNDVVEVRSGLVDGDLVITEGGYALPAGAAVEVEQPVEGAQP
jgi:multidrug efflux pump subunit AcrA (membrane-fusion protein)